jgi:hypothetical protein
MNFDDPNLRAIALKRIAVLQRLVDDLTDIIAGTRPTELDLDKAVVLRDSHLSAITVPTLIGYAENHPRLGSKIVTTSQVFAMDPKGKWARTLSRFYRLERSEVPRNASRIEDYGAGE